MSRFQKGDIVYTNEKFGFRKLLIDGFSESSNLYLVHFFVEGDGFDGFIYYEEKYLININDVISEHEYLSIMRKNKIENIK